jgi:hypothetical protein
MDILPQENNYKLHLLLAVWGEKFINDFLGLSLPSLLAPGNIPALTNQYETSFVFLTKTADIEVFEKHPAYQKLKTICKTEFISIDDLIVFGNYSTTLTLSFDRAIKQTGEQMLNTYFVFLTSDYIMADGSGEGLMRYIAKGYSGICMGNFQVIQEEIEQYLRDKIDPATHIMQIKSRELLVQGFKTLHPVTMASLFEQQAAHNYHANRFFVRYNAGIMAGRFYLQHMLCIKPETMDYRIGASCDYSFIPEMCPSGNITTINDSDDFLVVEVQPREHELGYVQFGPYHQNRLISALSEWTTHQHRENAKQSIYFHTREILQTEKDAIEKRLNQFIHDIDAGLKSYPEKPYYDHPYWIGAITSFREQNSILKNAKDYEYVDLTTISQASYLKKIFYRVFGEPPNVFRWHPRWYEYQMIKNIIQSYVHSNHHNTIALYDVYNVDFMRYRSWLKETLKIPRHYFMRSLLNSPAKLKKLQKANFDVCIFFVRLHDLGKITKSLNAIKKMLSTNGKMLVFISNEHNHYSRLIYDFQGEFAYKVHSLLSSSYHIKEIITVHNNLTLLGAMILSHVNKIFSHNKRLKFLFYILVGAPCSLLFLIRNYLSFGKRNIGHCTNIVTVLEPSEEI